MAKMTVAVEPAGTVIRSVFALLTAVKPGVTPVAGGDAITGGGVVATGATGDNTSSPLPPAAGLTAPHPAIVIALIPPPSTSRPCKRAASTSSRLGLPLVFLFISSGSMDVVQR